MTMTARLTTALFTSAACAAGALAAQPLTAAAPPMPSDATLQLAASGILHDGTFVGGTYDAYYGNVQVQTTVQGGQIVASKALKFPNRSGTSRSINRQALPYLLQEVVAKQSAKIAIISGATLTSRAYIKSLRDALAQSAK